MGTRKSGAKPVKLSGTIFLALLVGIFVAMGIGPVVHGLLRVLPTKEAPVEITGRDRRQPSTSYRTQSRAWSHYVKVRFADGREKEIQCRKELYAKALPGLRTLDNVRLRVSILAEHPVSVTLESIPLVNLPAINFVSKPTVETHPLLMPMSGVLIAGILAWGIVGWLAWKLREIKGVNWPVFALIVGLSACFGSWIWMR